MVNKMVTIKQIDFDGTWFYGVWWFELNGEEDGHTFNKEVYGVSIGGEYIDDYARLLTDTGKDAKVKQLIKVN